MPDKRPCSSASLRDFDYEHEDEEENECNLDQTSRKALAKFCGFSATHLVTASDTNHSPPSISSGCNWNGPSAAQR